jgi:hypothetical protein
MFRGRDSIWYEVGKLVRFEEVRQWVVVVMELAQKALVVLFSRVSKLQERSQSNKRHPSKAQARGWRNLTVTTL